MINREDYSTKRGNKMNEKEISEILKEHSLWLYSEGGKRADLFGADLRDANLFGADLCGADLRGANLYRADLRGANLRDANLCGANLSGANLFRADLFRASLWGADLRETDLCGANLRETDLCGANLSGADLRDAHLRGVSLRGAKRNKYILIDAPILICNGFGGRWPQIMGFCIPDEDGSIWIECGGWEGLIADFPKRIIEVYGASDIAKEFILMCDMLEGRRNRVGKQISKNERRIL